VLQNLRVPPVERELSVEGEVLAELSMLSISKCYTCDQRPIHEANRKHCGCNADGKL
jgi:hypothetical protein